MLLSLLTTVFFAASAVTTRRTLHFIDYRYAILWRLSIASVCLGAYTLLSARSFDVTVFGIFFTGGMIGMGLGDLAALQSMTRLGSRLTILLVQCVAAPLAALTEYVTMGTRLTWMEAAGAAVILTGVALALSPTGKDAPIRVTPAGIIYGLLGAAGQAWGAVLSRYGYADASARAVAIDGGTAACFRVLGGLLIALIFSISAFRNGGQAMHRLRAGWKWIVLNAVSGPILGVAFYQWALLSTPGGIVLPIVATTPLVVIPLARWMEDDRPSKASVLGGMISVAGVALLAFSRAG